MSREPTGRFGGLRSAALAAFGAGRRRRASFPAESEQIRSFIEQAPLAMALLDRNMHYIAASPRWHADLGLAPASLVGRSHYEVFPDTPEECKEVHRRALSGESVRKEREHRSRIDGHRQWTRWEVWPWGSADGGGIAIFVEKLTEREKAGPTLPPQQQHAAQPVPDRTADAIFESEARLRLATEAAGIGTFAIDLETGRASYSPQLIAMLGLPAICSANIEDAFARVHRDDKARFMAGYEAGLKGANGGHMRMDFRFVIPGGEIRWMALIGRVDFRVGTSGRVPFRVAAVCADITERKRAEEALRESEERFRGIFDHAAIGIAITDLEGRFQSCNPAYSEMLGHTQEELRALNFSGLVHPDDREADTANYSRLLQQWIPSFEALIRYTGKDGRLIWAHKHVSLLTDAAGKPDRMLALVTDVTGRKRQEENIRLLAREVNHRSKNLLTLVQAVARQTFATKPSEFMSRFEARIEALAASHDLLVKSSWKGARLDELARSQLAHFEDAAGSRVELKGQPLLITASAAQTLGMALHELATNAGKYGALSSPTGGVRIEWRAAAEAAGDARFELAWTEHGGPPVAPPAQTGFGTVVIEDIPRAELNAEVTLTYAPEGFRWRLACPAQCVLQTLDADAEAVPFTL